MVKKVFHIFLFFCIAASALAEDEFVLDGGRAFPTDAHLIAVNGGNWYGLWTDSSNISYLVCASIGSTNYTVMLSFPTTSTKTGLVGGSTIESVINSESFTNAVRGVALSPYPQQEDTDELSSYGLFGSIGAAITALIAAVASMHRSRIQQDSDGAYYFDVEEQQT